MLSSTYTSTSDDIRTSFSNLSLFPFLFLLLQMSISMLSVLHLSHVKYKSNARTEQIVDFLLSQPCGANIGGELQSIESICQKILGCLFGFIR